MNPTVSNEIVRLLTTKGPLLFAELDRDIPCLPRVLKTHLRGMSKEGVIIYDRDTRLYALARLKYDLQYFFIVFDFEKKDTTDYARNFGPFRTQAEMDIFTRPFYAKIRYKVCEAMIHVPYRGKR